MSKKNILVTGGAGFIGRHLCKELLNRGDNVICVDNLYTGTLLNISDFSHNNNFTFIEHDMCYPLDIDVDEIYNLACPASPVHYQNDPIKTTKTSVWGALHVLELAKKYNAKVLQASTSEVYGDPSEHPQNETYWGNVNPTGVRSCYDEGKRCAETLFFDYHRVYEIHSKVIRIFNTYGPYMQPNDGRVVSNFILQALKNEPITLYGDGCQTRSFCFVDDLVQGILAMMSTNDTVIGPVNLGNPNEFTIAELAHLVIQMTSSESVIKYLPLPQDDPKQRQPDITRAKELLGWSPVVQLHEGLTQTISYFKKILQ